MSLRQSWSMGLLECQQTIQSLILLTSQKNQNTSSLDAKPIKRLGFILLTSNGRDLHLNKQLVYLAAQELIKRRKARAPIYDESFPKQKDFVADNSTFVGACCTRRSGKTVGLAYKYINKAKLHSNIMMPYIALTRDSAKNIMWPVFQELNKKHNIGGQFLEADLTYKIASDKTVKLYGADMANFINRLRGIKTPMAGIDEMQSFRNHLEELVDDILTPAISDYADGQIVATGTPGPVPKGYFYDITTGKSGYSVHRWSVYDNPYMPNSREFVERLMKTKNWTETHPTYRREWLGEWVADPDALVYKFSSILNVIREVPQKEWMYVLGVDLGYDPDPSAFVLCAYSLWDRNLYIIDTHKENKMTVSDVAERIRYYQKAHPYLQITIDAGAQGKMIAEEITQRFGIPLVAAEKNGKAGFIEIMNSDFQNGLIKLVDSQTKELQEELMNLIWDTEKTQRVEDSRYPNHLTDAALYAWRYCYNYTARDFVEKPKKDTDEYMNEWWQQEADRLAQREMKKGEDEWI